MDLIPNGFPGLAFGNRSRLATVNAASESSIAIRLKSLQLIAEHPGVVLDWGRNADIGDAVLENGLISFRFDGKITASDVARTAHRVSMQLIKEDDRLYGIASALSMIDTPKFLRPYYVELTRVK